MARRRISSVRPGLAHSLVEATSAIRALHGEEIIKLAWGTDVTHIVREAMASVGYRVPMFDEFCSHGHHHCCHCEREMERLFFDVGLPFLALQECDCAPPHCCQYTWWARIEPVGYLWISCYDEPGDLIHQVFLDNPGLSEGC